MSADFITSDRDDDSDLDLVEHQPHPFRTESTLLAGTTRTSDHDAFINAAEAAVNNASAIHQEFLIQHELLDRGFFDYLFSNTTPSEHPVDVHSYVADLAHRQPTVEDMGLWHVTVKVCHTFHKEACFLITPLRFPRPERN
jgi:hypothetical protein